MQVLLDDHLHVMEVGGAQQCTRVEHAAQSGVVLLLLGATRLQCEVSQWALDSDRNLWLGGLSGKDHNILMESDVALANDAVDCSRE